MTRESLQENYTNCTAPLKNQKFWAYVQIVLHVVSTVCLVAAYVMAIGNGTEFIASRFIPYSVCSAVFGFCCYATIRSVIDIKAINREIKLFDDVHQSAIEALEVIPQPIKTKDKPDDASDSIHCLDEFLERWGFHDDSDINIQDVVQHRLHDAKNISAMLSKIIVTADAVNWPDGAYYVSLHGKYVRVSKSVMMQMYKDLTSLPGFKLTLIAIPASYVDDYVSAYLKMV